MRISDWSSDVCSSDLTDGEVVEAPTEETGEEEVVAETPGAEEISVAEEAEKPSPLKGRGLGEGAEAAPASAAIPLSPEGERGKKSVLASPAVRARARDLGVDLSQVQAEGDRIRHSDLDAFLRYSAGQGYHAPGASRARTDEPVKVIGMRRKIAENMAASKRAIPHFTYVEEMDVTALEARRADLKHGRAHV